MHHYVGVYDPPKFLKAYLNGSEVASREVGFLQLGHKFKQHGLRNEYAAHQPVCGIIDEIIIYNGALSAEEVEACYTSALP